MAQLYNLRTSAGSTIVPVGDGAVTLSGVPIDHPNGLVFIRFTDAAGGTVTPTGGTVTFDAGVVDGQFLAASANGTVTATEVVDGNATYTPPSFNGPSSLFGPPLPASRVP